MTSLLNLEAEHQHAACILGGGFAGLACAHVLHSNGLKVALVEKEQAPGGNGLTFEADGFRFDLGHQALETSDPVVSRYFGSVLGSDAVEVTADRRLFYKGRYLHCPVSVSAALMNAGPLSGPLGLAGYLWSQTLGSSREAGRLDQALRGRYGSKFSQVFFDSYCHKVWGDPPPLISADFDCCPGRVPESGNRQFDYPLHGIGQFGERLARLLGPEQLWTKTEVNRIAVKNQRVAYVECGQPPLKHRLRADEYLSAIPLIKLVRLLDPLPPADVLDAAHRLPNRNLVIAAVVIKRDSFSQAASIDISEPSVRALRIHEPKNKSPEMAPEDRTMLVVEYPCSGGDDIWSAPEDRNQRRAFHELTHKLGLVREDEVESIHVRRYEDAYPVASTGYRQLRQRIFDYVGGIGNLHLIGRTGRHRYGDLGHGIEMGLKAASNILGSDFDLERINPPLSGPNGLPPESRDRKWLESEPILSATRPSQGQPAPTSQSF